MYPPLGHIEDVDYKIDIFRNTQHITSYIYNIPLLLLFRDAVINMSYKYR